MKQKLADTGNKLTGGRQEGVGGRREKGEGPMCKSPVIKAVAEVLSTARGI